MGTAELFALYSVARQARTAVSVGPSDVMPSFRPMLSVRRSLGLSLFHFHSNLEYSAVLTYTIETLSL